MKPIHDTLLAVACILLAAGGCTTTDQATPVTPTTQTTAPTLTSQPTSTPAAQQDPFDQYAALIGPLEPTLTRQQLREKYDTAVRMFCPGGREQMVKLKALASNPPGATTDKAKTANENAAKSIGALWEFGCGKGHDTDLYTPTPVKGAQTKAPWPCEPGYPNCTKAESDRYLAQLEHKKATEVRDANGETKEEYCRRTGQPLATCQAG